MAFLQFLDHVPQRLIWVICPILIALCWVASTIISYRRLRHIPGPRIAAFSQWWLIKTMASGKQHLRIAQVLSDYGPLARIGPNDLITSDVNYLRKMNAARSTYTRSDWFAAFKFNPERDNIVSERGEVRHAALRNKMAAGYAGKENPGLEADIDTNMLNLFDLIDRKYISSSSKLIRMDFGKKIQYFTLDVIAKVAFGKKFGYVDNDTDMHDYIAVTEANLPNMIVFGVIPLLGYLLRQKWVLKLMAPTERDVSGLGKMMGLAKKIVGERYAPDSKDQMDMLGSFKRHGLTRDEAESECLLQIMAGSDTTAGAIRTIFIQICSRPLVFNKLRSEIDLAESQGRISRPIIKEKEGREFPYLQACIREGLRVCPPITGPLSKLAPPEGDTYEGMYIPPGTHVGISLWAMNRDKPTFGEDVEMFRPERWLEADIDRRAAMERTTDVVFGNGRFSCLGKTVAFMELNKIFVELLLRYDWSIIDATEPWKASNFGLHFHDDFFVRATDRAPTK